jgi:ribosome recycling factor
LKFLILFIKYKGKIGTYYVPTCGRQGLISITVWDKDDIPVEGRGLISITVWDKDDIPAEGRGLISITVWDKADIPFVMKVTVRFQTKKQTL